MDCDLLFYWMTHMGEGSWEGFRRSVKELTSTDDHLMDTCRHLRVGLSDLGYVDFFVAGSQKWKVLPPVLGGLPMRADTFVLSGGRTPKLLSNLESAAQKRGCQIDQYAQELGPARIYVTGDESVLPGLAAEAHIAYSRNLAAQLCERLVPIFEQFERAEEERPPINWKVRSFDLQSLKWVDGLQLRSACEYTPTYGRPLYFLHTRKGHLFRMSKRDAVYASAALRDFSLLTYDLARSELSTPIEAPLPEPLARIACLSSGLPARVDRGRLWYEEVPQEIAAILAVAASQHFPQIEALAGVSG
jgi:hypothetical protein